MQYTVPVQFKPKQQKEVVDTQVHNCVPSEPQGPIEPEEEVFDKDYFEEMPEFPGGMEKLIQFIEENTHLPKCVTDGKVQGRSVIEMVVEKDDSTKTVMPKPSESSKQCRNGNQVRYVENLYV